MMESNLVLFRLSDDRSIYVADLETGTVERRDPSEITTEDAEFAGLVSGKASEASAFRGVDFALAASVRSTAASHVYYPVR